MFARLALVALIAAACSLPHASNRSGEPRLSVAPRGGDVPLASFDYAFTPQSAAASALVGSPVNLTGWLTAETEIDVWAGVGQDAPRLARLPQGSWIEARG